jgi:putative flippase GtrA
LAFSAQVSLFHSPFLAFLVTALSQFRRNPIPPPKGWGLILRFKMNLKNLKQFLTYCLCGGLGVTFDYFSFYLTLSFGFWYQAANVIGYSAGTLLSFFLNRMITFHVYDKVIKRMLLFFVVALIGFFASAILLWFMVDRMLISAKLAKLLTLPVVVIIQFSINRWITFKDQPQALFIGMKPLEMTNRKNS